MNAPYRESKPYPTKNHGRLHTRPGILVAHTTEGGSKAWLDSAFSGRDPSYTKSVHWCVYEDGSIIEYAPWKPGEAVACWHAGVSQWRGMNSCNYWSLGFEIQHVAGRPYPEAQIRAVIELVRVVREAYPIIELVTHAQIARPIGRKTDPTKPWKTDVYPRIQKALSTKEETDMTDEERKALNEAVLYGKQNRLSNLARSHDVEIIKAMIQGLPEERIQQMEVAKQEDVDKERRALGL